MTSRVVFCSVGRRHRSVILIVIVRTRFVWHRLLGFLFFRSTSRKNIERKLLILFSGNIKSVARPTRMLSATKKLSSVFFLTEQKVLVSQRLQPATMLGFTSRQMGPSVF